MDFKATFSNRRISRRHGFTLTEILMATGVGGILLGAVVMFSMYTARSFAALSNWMELDQANRIAIDKMARDIRQVNRMTGYHTNSVTFEDADGLALTFTNDPVNKTLTRVKGLSTQLLLRECDGIVFTRMQRNIIEGSYTYYPTDTFEECKVVGITWNCSRSIMGRKTQISGGQTTAVVIRKQ